LKNIIALLWFISIASMAICLAVGKKNDNKLTTILLVFAIVSGLAITNYDVIKSIKFWELEVETAK
jgi:formate-dependent nitrite reductase membrane component NrfD